MTKRDGQTPVRVPKAGGRLYSVRNLDNIWRRRTITKPIQIMLGG